MNLFMAPGPLQAFTRTTLAPLCGALVLISTLVACGSSGGGSTSTEPNPPGELAPGPEPSPGQEPGPGPGPNGESKPVCAEIEFESTFDAVQEIFTLHCTQCHGENALGGLDLREGSSYDNLFEVPSVGSDNWRVYPGDTERSHLYNKLAAWTDDSIVISGGRMPPNGSLSDDELNLIRFWIYSGAALDVMVQGTEEILEDACLAPPGVFAIEPLDAPDSSEGIQMTMPAQIVANSSETETCMAVYEDFCDQIPEEYRLPGTNLFRYDTTEIRMPPFSHHLLVGAPLANFGTEVIGPDDFTDWACVGGALEGEACDPKDTAGCGEGRCATPLLQRTGCNGYPPAGNTVTQTYTGTQQPQFYRRLVDGVFGVAPCKTVVLYNLHAFNLTAEDASVGAQINFEFATNARWERRVITTDDRERWGPLAPFGIGRLLAEGAEAYTENTLCTEVTLPQGAYLSGGQSHTHALGARSTWTNPDGDIIYDSPFYNDPVLLHYEEPIHFPDADPESRTFEFCTLYRNGIDENGEIDIDRLSRSSTRPYTFSGPNSSDQAGCEPYRCINEGVDRRSINCDDGIRNLTGDHSACDSSPGAGDGFCDACSIRGGITTQDEMYRGSLNYFLKD